MNTPKIALTFDDGPSEWTPQLLDLLDAYGVRATFFATGQAIVGRTAILASVANAGHEIGNHGWSHTRLTTLDDHDVHAELATTSELIWLATGRYPTVWRAPYYAADERVLAIGAGLGMRHVEATIVPDDWMALDAVALAAVVLDELTPGALVGLHDGVPPRGGSERCTQSRALTVEAVRLILEGCA